MKIRKIDQRFKPSVKGIDLWQAMNYIALEDVSPDFIYNRYTSSTICYVPGSRPELEKIAKKFSGENSVSLKNVMPLARYIADEVRWAGHYEREKGHRLPTDRNLTEEQILVSGFGWCNEQARLFCALAQIRGFPSRLVFACDPTGSYGHVVSEVLTSKGWMMVDQSFGYCFTYGGLPISAWDVARRPLMSRYFGPIYHSMCRRLEQVLGCDILTRDFKMAAARNPLRGFKQLGYCNHFV